MKQCYHHEHVFHITPQRLKAPLRRGLKRKAVTNKATMMLCNALKPRYEGG